jgi:hypothetical protein
MKQNPSWEANNYLVKKFPKTQFLSYNKNLKQKNVFLLEVPTLSMLK